MVDWKTHIIFGVVFTTIIYMILRFFTSIQVKDVYYLLFLPLIIIYTLLPDVDIEGSIIRKFIDTLIFFIIIGSILIFFLTENNTYLFLSIVVSLIGLCLFLLKHRGSVHSLIGSILFAAPILFIDTFLACLCMIAFLSHLLIDGEFKVL